MEMEISRENFPEKENKLTIAWREKNTYIYDYEPEALKKKHYKNEEMVKEKILKYGSDLKVEQQTKQSFDNKFSTACPGAEIFDHRNCRSSLISGNSPSMNSSVQVAIIFSAFATGFHLQNLCINGSLFALEAQITNPGELVWYIKKYIWSLFLIPRTEHLKPSKLP